MMSMRGVPWQTHDAIALVDEHPAAYKQVERVMTDQADLIDIEHTLRAVANYKGVEEPEATAAHSAQVPHCATR
jgi:hypothetical protein